MSCDFAVEVNNVSKSFRIYDKPIRRLEQSTLFRLKQALGLNPQVCYRDYCVLNDVSFNVRKGETVGIVGNNGSGKSTLLEIICGTLAPTEGTVVTTGRLGALLELGSGFNPEFTGRENVYLNAAILGMEEAEVHKRFERIAAFADIGKFMEQPVKTYSTGMFVRLAFSVQANMDPEVLVVDEALSVGDAYFVHRCMLRIRELQKQGTSILFVSHDANTVKELCSRAIWLNDTKVCQIGSASDVVDEYLAYTFGHQRVNHECHKKKENEVPASVRTDKCHEIETEIPNCDRRLGDQKLKIIGIGLYDRNLSPITAIYNEQDLILRVSIENDVMVTEHALYVGYIFRNEKGVEIASNNSMIEGKEIRMPDLRQIVSVRMRISLPCLYPGSYSFSITTGYKDEYERLHVCDRIDNGVIFTILSKKELHVMMSFPTVFEVEQELAGYL
jgi:lipopolysaccharide transport system ATP-binding protein